MALMRGFARVDEKGHIPIPKNMRREAELKPGQLVELKVQGSANAQFLVVRKRAAPR